MSGLKRTPLYPIYEKYGAKTVAFAGWELPVQFSGIVSEHEAVRERAGLFDVSHMGEIRVTGSDALSFLQKMTTNDVSALNDGQVQYSVMCYPDGGTVDDLLVYRFSETDYLLVVNAANTEKDFAWLKNHLQGDVSIENISEKTAQLALQGPLAQTVLQKLSDADLMQIAPFCFQNHVLLASYPALVSRTGYTGEDGFEIYLDPQHAIPLWEKILEAGSEFGVIPCGLGARDTLRFEARLPLYGQELSETISPIEAGVGFVVKTDKKEPFIGKDVLVRQKGEGAPRKLVGIEMVDKGIARGGYPVWLDNEKIGVVTTGTQSPTLKKNVALALVKSEYASPGTVLEVEIRGQRKKAMIVKTPFYKRMAGK
jgi:aminomethyltransferase